MARYAAFLRGVMPTNAKMPELKRAFELAGFDNVKTVLGSGNVVFDTRARSESSIVAKAEAAMQKHLGRTFMPFVRSLDELRALLETDPYELYAVDPAAKRVVTFLPQAPKRKLALPAELGGARLLCVKGREAFTAYVRGAAAPEFMKLIEGTFGKDVTTRTWDTVAKVAR